MLIGWIRYETGIIAYGEPWGASYWFPVNEHPSDKALYTFIVTVPEPYEAESNGELVETMDHGETVTYVWESAHEMASYLGSSRWNGIFCHGASGCEPVPTPGHD